MNNKLFFLGLVGATLLSACSSDELAVDDSIKISPEEERALIIEAGQDSEIPILFGAIGNKRYAMTRAPLESNEQGLFQIDGTDGYLGIFCLATGKQNENQMINSILPATSAGINWSSSQYANWLNNVPAKVVKYESGTINESPIYPSETYSEVHFVNPSDLSLQKHYYYPFGNWYHYNFYAYYPRVGATTIDASNVYADYTITGKEDIIQGVASLSVTDNTYILQHALPYSAKYYRIKNGASLTTAFDDLPTLALEHKLAKIIVVVKAHDAIHAAALADRSVVLTNVNIAGVYKDLRLCVASKSSSLPTPTGQLTKQSNATSGDLAIWKVADDSDPFGNDTTIPITVAETTIGYAMLPPTALLGENEKYMINLKMRQDGGDPLPDFPVVLENSDGSSMTFEAGHSYEIKLDIYSPSEIYVKATLRDWVDEDTTTIEVD